MLGAQDWQQVPLPSLDETLRLRFHDCEWVPAGQPHGQTRLNHTVYVIIRHVIVFADCNTSSPGRDRIGAAASTRILSRTINRSSSPLRAHLPMYYLYFTFSKKTLSALNVSRKGPSFAAAAASHLPMHGCRQNRNNHVFDPMRVLQSCHIRHHHTPGSSRLEPLQTNPWRQKKLSSIHPKRI